MAERDELLSHEYDGIQEYDNDLPKWWIWLFVLCVIWGVWRVGYYHFGPGLSQEEQFVVSMAELEEKRAAAVPAAGEGVSEESLLALVNNAEAVAAGEALYNANCMACHLQGQGLVGPNLTDDYWIHGGTLINIYDVIENGVLEKGMIAWKEKFSIEQMSQVSVYVWALHGKELANPKAPQGEQFIRP